MLNRNVSIEGLGESELSVSGGGASEVFNVADGVTATISGVTITDGVYNPGYYGFAYGGGIVNSGVLSLDDVVVSGNQTIGFFAEGGGIYNTGNLTLSHSEVTGNQANSVEIGGSGGGIENAAGGTLIVTNSVVSNNQVTSSTSSSVTGGGIENAAGGTLTVTHSVVSNNEVTSSSSSSVTGGGIDNHVGGTATVIDSTMTGNTAVGGPGFFSGTWAYGGAISDEGRSLFPAVRSRITRPMAAATGPMQGTRLGERFRCLPRPAALARSLPH